MSSWGISNTACVGNEMYNLVISLRYCVMFDDALETHVIEYLEVYIGSWKLHDFHKIHVMGKGLMMH